MLHFLKLFFIYFLKRGVLFLYIAMKRTWKGYEVAIHWKTAESQNQTVACGLTQKCMKKAVLRYIMTVAYVVNVCQWMKYVRETT